MKYDFMCKVDALNNDEYRKKISWLNVGIWGCVVAVICEVLIDNYIGLAFAVPMLTMFTYKKRVGTCMGYINCVVSFTGEGDMMKATLQNVVFIDEENCSEVYEAKAGSIRANYKKKKACLVLRANWRKYYINPENETVIKPRKAKRLYLYLDPDNAQTIKEIVKAK